MKNILLLTFIITLASSCSSSFQQKADHKRDLTAEQIKENGYTMRERYQVDINDNSKKIIKEILMFDKDGNILSRAKIGNTRDDITSLIEYDYDAEGKLLGYMNFNNGLYTTLTNDSEGKVIESNQRDTLDNLVNTIYFDWEGNTCYQSVYGADQLLYSDTLVVDDWGNTISKSTVTTVYTYDDLGNILKTVETNTSNSDQIIIEKEFDDQLILNEIVYLPTGEKLRFEYYYNK